MAITTYRSKPPRQIGPDDPCQCHDSHAYISPTHGGHCCFLPASQTCHPDAFQTWLTNDARLNGYNPEQRMAKWLTETGGHTQVYRP